MGRIVHRAMIVITRKEEIESVYALAQNMFPAGVSAPIRSALNGCYSIFIAPDSSKAGWDDEKYWNATRQQFKDWLICRRDEDGGSPFEWAEIEICSDTSSAVVTDSEWA